MTTTKCKIPIGSFFGHTMILPGECGPENALIPMVTESNLQVCLQAKYYYFIF